jgi:hypothetical protein
MSPQRRARWSVSAECDFRHRNQLFGERVAVGILFLVTLPAIAKSQTYAQCHDSQRRGHQDHDTSSYGLLAVFGSCRSGAVAHRTALCERRNCPQTQQPNQQDKATSYRTRPDTLTRSLHRRFHFAPNERMRNASGKKTIIMARQNTSEVMVSHFMRDTSYFMCMK